MLGIHQETTSPPAAIRRKKHLHSNAMKRTSEWILSQEIPSDVAVHAGGATFSLHKFPLMSKSGYMRKLLFQSHGSNSTPLVAIPDFPGGAEVFDLAAKFCYGAHCEITTHNVAMLRCAAEYLEMTEDYVVGNLVNRTEAYLEEVVLPSLSCSVAVLRKSEELGSIAEKVRLVSRCINAIACIAYNDSQESLSSSSLSQNKDIVDWWVEELTVLRTGTFQRVIMEMKSRGFRQHALVLVLMLYAQNSLRGLDLFARGRKKIEPKQEHEKRIVLETIVSLLPKERNSMSVSFLSMLLRSSIYLETTVACRLGLEERMGLQLGQAVLDDLLIPSSSFNDDTMFDVDTVQAILANYIEHNDYVDVERVGRLMESYIAEIATDPKLAISSFISFAEMIPEQAMVSEDHIYRAVDIYLKCHPSLSDMERRKVCSLMDFQNLSREACAHAAQNERLPAHIVVQVLSCEQQRLRDAMDGGFSEGENELLRMQRENDELKLELVRIKMEAKEIDKPAGDIVASVEKPPLPKKSFVNSASRKLGRMYPFVHSENTTKTVSAGKDRTKPNKNRRYSIS